MQDKWQNSEGWGMTIIAPITFYIPCLFGLEGLVGDELRRLNMHNIRVA